MAALGKKLRTIAGGRLAFWCPGCDEMHVISVALVPEVPERKSCWSFNGNIERPTFTPSVLVQSGHYMPGHNKAKGCWCDFEARTGDQSDFQCGQCHSFVTDGRIQFLGDCTHSLANQTVELPDFPMNL